MLGVKFFLQFGWLVVGMVGVAGMWCVAAREVDLIRKNFRRSKAVSLFFEDFGYSKTTFVALVAGLVTWPSRHLVEGMLDPQELESLPRAVTLKLKVALLLVLLSIIWLVIAFVYAAVKS